MARYSSLLQPMISFISASERYSGRCTGSTCVRTVCLCVCVCTLCVHVQMACRWRVVFLGNKSMHAGCTFALCVMVWCIIVYIHICSVHTHVQCVVIAVYVISLGYLLSSQRFAASQGKKAKKKVLKKNTWLSTSASRALSSA